MVLTRWKQTEDTGGISWFQNARLLILVLVIGALFIADTIVPIIFSVVRKGTCEWRRLQSEKNIKKWGLPINTYLLVCDNEIIRQLTMYEQAFCSYTRLSR